MANANVTLKSKISLYRAKIVTKLLKMEPAINPPGPSWIISVNINRNWGLPYKYAVSTSEIDHTVKSKDGTVVGAAFAGDERVVVVFESGQAIVWNIAKEETTETIFLLNKVVRKSPITCFSVCPHASWLLALGMKNGLIVVVDIRVESEVAHVGIEGDSNKVAGAVNEGSDGVELEIAQVENLCSRKFVDSVQEQRTPPIQESSTFNDSIVLNSTSSTPLGNNDELIENVAIPQVSEALNDNAGGAKSLPEKACQEGANSEEELTKAPKRNNKEKKLASQLMTSQNQEDTNRDVELSASLSLENISCGTSSVSEMQRDTDSMTDRRVLSMDLTLCDEPHPLILETIPKDSKISETETALDEQDQSNIAADGPVHGDIQSSEELAALAPQKIPDWRAENKDPVCTEEQPRKEYLLASSAQEDNIYIWRAGTDGRLQTLLKPSKTYANNKFAARKAVCWTTVCWISPNILLSSNASAKLVKWTLPKPSDERTESQLLHDLHYKALTAIAAPITYCNEYNFLQNRSLTAWSIGVEKLLVNYDVSNSKRNIIYCTGGGSASCCAVSPMDPYRLAIGTSNREVHIWKISHLDETYYPGVFYEKILGAVTALAWHSSKENCLAWGTVEGRLFVGTFKISSSEKFELDEVFYSSLKLESIAWHPQADQAGNNSVYSQMFASIEKFNHMCIIDLSIKLEDMKKLLLWKLTGECEGIDSKKSDIDILHVFGNSKLRSAKQLSHMNMLSLFEGDISTVYKQAVEEKRVDSWNILMAPLVSSELWKKAYEIYATQLMDEPESDPMQIVSLLLACHKVEESVNFLCEKQMFREAFLLAKTRCGANSALVVSTLTKWANVSYIQGLYEQTASAAELLHRRTSVPMLEMSAYLAKLANNEELLQSVQVKLRKLAESDDELGESRKLDSNLEAVIDTYLTQFASETAESLPFSEITNRQLGTSFSSLNENDENVASGYQDPKERHITMINNMKLDESLMNRLPYPMHKLMEMFDCPLHIGCENTLTELESDFLQIALGDQDDTHTSISDTIPEHPANEQ
ncbi:hypothetical protein D910_08887 [Dendroctonus ponderosae]|uniref:Gem-associated protein 5 TPR domain-containing protein n=1 Tax=Dendroctonus ponderosae TaxID=77166 RepID=U4UEU0_DENPD|nr:hypothetical protein D910_08887 [Dendroctonus ponderosae]